MGSASVRLGRYTIMRHLTPDVAIARDGDKHVIFRSPPGDPTKLLQFVEAARLAQKIEHANAIRVLEVGDDGMASEYHHGEDARLLLETVVKAKALLPIQHAIAISLGAAAGVAAAHNLPTGDKKLGAILHRDVSPSNVIVGRNGIVKVIDFEIARALGGKLAYMSPEQVRDQPLDKRSDVFSLGILLYELATTSRLFRGDLATIQDAIVNGKIPLPRVRRPDLPNELGIIIMRALSTDPARRYQSAEDLRVVLEQFALAAQVPLAPRTLADYIRKACGGDRIEPWRVEGFETGASGSSGASGASSAGSTPTPRSIGKASWVESSARRGGGGDSEPGAKRGSRPSGTIIPGTQSGQFKLQTGPVARVNGDRGSRPSSSGTMIPSTSAPNWNDTLPKSGEKSLLAKLAIPGLVVLALIALGLVVMFVMADSKKTPVKPDDKHVAPNVAPTLATDPTPGSAAAKPLEPGVTGSGSGSGATTNAVKPTGTHPTNPQDKPHVTPQDGPTDNSITSVGSNTKVDVPPDASVAVAPPVDAGAPEGSAATAPVIAQLSAITIDGVARDHAGELGKCDTSDLHGTLAVNFQIDATGKVTSAQLSSTAGKPQAAVCFLRSIQHWQFPRPPTGAARGTYAVTLP